MRKRSLGICAIIIYVLLDAALILNLWWKPAQQDDTTEQTEEELTAEENETENIVEQTGPDREFPMVENNYEYATAAQVGLYAVSNELDLYAEDTENILNRYNLPELERMEDTDAEEKMSGLQVLRRIEELDIDIEEIMTPEYGWKSVYNDSITQLMTALDFDEEISFEGTKASELNEFLADKSNSGKYVNICSDEILLDETIVIPSNVILDGNGVNIASQDEEAEYAILVENAENIGIYNINLTGGFGQGIYVITSNHVLIYGNEITNATYKAVCVMGENSYINLVNNSIHDNGNGAVFYDGSISNCILQGNSIYQNRGTRNLTAGIVFSAMYVEDIYTPYNTFLDEYLYEQTEAPHHNVLKDNLIQGNYSSGFYCDGGYINYVIDNIIEENEKEGMCLDYGTFGTYVSGNLIRENGNRNRQTDEDLTADFILEWGRLEDGSSKAKLPGLSIDNSAYNIIYNNSICDNSGSGVKMVRSGYRNLILSNVIADNNRGMSEAYHGFGVELGYAVEPDEPVIGLDFTPDYENIIARNVITGIHSSGIYLAADTYCNDIIDNIIADCEYAVENHSSYFNSAVGNSTNVPCLDFATD